MMSTRSWLPTIAACAVALCGGAAGVAQEDASGTPGPQSVTMPGPPQAPDAGSYGSGQIALFRVRPEVTPRAQYTPEDLAGRLMQTPTTNLFPGSVAVDPGVANPVANDPDAVERGKQHYNAFNCVGCHAPNGSGGEGPSLSNSRWIYGSDPADIFLTLVHGRPNGMPAFGAMLPDQTIWELVAYIHSIAKDPDETFGRTISRSQPATEQVPAEYIQTTDPWQHTQPFMNGQPPPRVGEATGQQQAPAQDQPDAG